PAWRVLDHEGRLDLVEAVVGQVAAYGLAGFGAHAQLLLQLGAAEIQVPVLQAQSLVGLDAVLDLEGRRLGSREDLELVNLDLDGAGRHVGVLLAASRGDLTNDADAELVAQV